MRFPADLQQEAIGESGKSSLQTSPVVFENLLIVTVLSSGDSPAMGPGYWPKTPAPQRLWCFDLVCRVLGGLRLPGMIPYPY